MVTRSPAGQLALLDWSPPEPVVRFDADQVRASSMADRISRAVAQTLKDHELTREEIAQRMSDFLGSPVSVNMLNGYASQARADHAITLVRFCALLHATGDRRLIELIADMHGWAVVEQRHVKMIKLATIQAREIDLRHEREKLQREARLEGLLG